MDLYTTLLRPLMFSGLQLDPENLHHQSLMLLGWLVDHRHQPTGAWVVRQCHQNFGLRDPRLTQQLWGLSLENPVGLAAGFDKDGRGMPIWGAFGFGFAELGTVTQHAQSGNSRPRLFRLLQDRAVLNRMGFNNAGAEALARRLAAYATEDSVWAAGLGEAGLGEAGGLGRIPIGINLGKSKVTPLEEAVADYCASFRLLSAWGDYFVVNVSSPNTPGLRSLQAVDSLGPILAALQTENSQNRPLLLKIAPDLDWADLEAILDLVQQYALAGIIATNTTIARTGLRQEVLGATGNPLSAEAGGISGAPLRQRSTEVIRFIYRYTQGRVPIIGVGGIFSAEDAWDKITAGASLVQIYTGWIYEGPWLVRRILAGVLQRLEAEGLGTIAEAVGVAAER